MAAGVFFSQVIASIGHVFLQRPHILHFFDILHASFTLDNPVQDIEHDLHSHTTGNTFSAGFVHRKVCEEPGCIHHAGVIVHHDQTPGTHHGSCLIEGVKINIDL